jgi:hypothetical protein
MTQFTHAHCQNCGRIYRGPHENEVYDRRDAAGVIEPVYRLDEHGAHYYEDVAASGEAYNVGNGMCPGCYQSALEEVRKHKLAVQYGQEGMAKQAEVHAERKRAQERRKERIEARKQFHLHVEPAERARRGYKARGEASAHAVEGTPGDLPPLP